MGASVLSGEPYGRWIALVFRMLPYPLILLSALLFAAETASMHGFVSGDFDIFRMAAQRALEDPARLYEETGEAGPVGPRQAAEALMGYIYPPPSIALFVPLALTDRMTAYALAGAMALLAAALAMGLWLRLLTKAGIVGRQVAPRVAVLCMALVTGAVFTCRAGRIDTIVLLVMVAAVACGEDRRRGSQAAAGALLAVGSWIKIYPALLILPRLLEARRPWACLAGFAAAGVLVPLVLAVWLPLSVWTDYFLLMLPTMSERTIVNIDNQSLAAIAGRMIAPRAIALDNSFTAIEVPFAIRWGILAAAVAGLLLVHRLVGRAGGSRLVTAAVVMALTSLVAPLGWGHSYAYVLPLFAMVLIQAMERRALFWTLAIGAGWCAQVIPAHNIIPALERIDPLWHLYYARNALATLVFVAAQFALIRRPVAAAETPRA